MLYREFLFRMVDLELLSAQGGVRNDETSRAIAQWKLDHYATEYGQAKLSMARAAREASVSIRKMQSYVRGRKIAAQYDREELEHGLKTVYARLG
ncbi:MAG: hypothetical protein ACLQU1_37730 [Bryobacteraceae bacterium]